MTIGRRGFMYGAGASSILAAFGAGFVQAASAAPTLTGQDLETLRSRWVDSLTGRKLIVESPDTFTEAIARMDRGVDSRLERVDPTPTQFFSNWDWSTGPSEVTMSNKMRMNYVDLQSLATAWATPGSRHEGSAEVLDVLKQGLEHMYTTIYNPDTQWWGNWWSWNIGASRPLADIMAILHAELEQEAITKYCAGFDHFLPDRDPRLQLSASGPRISDGANRVDICQATIIRSIVEPDTELLRDAIDALSPTWQYVTEGNGFFRDGSFIQHSTIGYTGTYGLVLLGGLADLFSLLAGTVFEITDETRSNILGAIDESFAPLMYNGQMMDSVRGRAISRSGERSQDNGNALIEYTLRLAGAADPETAKRWRGLCKQWILSNSGSDITETTNIVRLALVTELMDSDVEPVQDVAGPRMFPAMDRLVYRAPDNSWALCVAMCSNRIAWSEGSPQENFNGVKTSQGMTYVYLADDDDHFDDEYWATSSLEAPVGTTVDLTPLEANPEGTWGNKTPANEWTGGTQLANMAVAGMHLIAPGSTGLTARKTWITLPDMVIALGSDISTESDAAVKTVVEHRNLGIDPRSMVVDGTTVSDEAPIDTPRWGHVQDVGGYLFLDDSATVLASVAEYEGAWIRNNSNASTGNDTVHRRYYATLAYHHGVGSDVTDATYAYALLPQATLSATIARADAPGFTILSNDGTTQGVSLSSGVIAANFWKPGTVGAFSCGAGTSLLARPGDKRLDMAVSDPTHQQDAIQVSIAEMSTKAVTGTDAELVAFTVDESGTNLTIDTTGTAGRTLSFTLEEEQVQTSPTPSETPSAEPSETMTPSASPTPSSSPTATPSATSSPTATQSPSPTPSPSTSTPTTTSTPSATPTTSATPTPRPSSTPPGNRPSLPKTGA